MKKIALLVVLCGWIFCGLAQGQSIMSNVTGIPSAIVITSNAVNNNATPDTMQDVTGLSFAVTNGASYYFRFFITFTAAASTTGSGWSINGPTVSQLGYRTNWTVNTDTFNAKTGTAYDGHSVSTSSLNGINTCIIEGTMTATANGTLIARFSSEVAGSAITALAFQSYLSVVRTN